MAVFVGIKRNLDVDTCTTESEYCHNVLLLSLLSEWMSTGWRRMMTLHYIISIILSLKSGFHVEEVCI